MDFDSWYIHFSAVMAFNFVGDGLRDALDPNRWVKKYCWKIYSRSHAGSNVQIIASSEEFLLGFR